MSKDSIRRFAHKEIRGRWDREGGKRGEWACEGEPKENE